MTADRWMYSCLLVLLVLSCYIGMRLIYFNVTEVVKLIAHKPLVRVEGVDSTKHCAWNRRSLTECIFRLVSDVTTLDARQASRLRQYVASKVQLDATVFPEFRIADVVYNLQVMGKDISSIDWALVDRSVAEWLHSGSLSCVIVYVVIGYPFGQ